MSIPDPLDAERLSHLYRERFADQDQMFKERAWDILCRSAFQRYVKDTDTVLDLGAGRCEFINAIHCGEKIAVDLNPDVKAYARDARVVITSSLDLSAIEPGSVDVVFSSNFLEHLSGKAAVLGTLEQCHRVLRPGGTLIVLMPNIRYLHGRYWDYFDHHTPLTDFSLGEALKLTGFGLERVVPRFLPYTVKQTSVPKSLLLLRLYLRLPFVWPIFGRQMLVVGRRTS
ncbi:MAG: methyltransferase domain-containing protein [Actinomycetota bacterium]